MPLHIFTQAEKRKKIKDTNGPERKTSYRLCSLAKEWGAEIRNGQEVHTMTAHLWIRGQGPLNTRT